MASAAVAASSSGANEIVAAPGVGRQIRVTGWALMSSGAVTAKWQGGSTDKTGAMLFAASVSSVVAPANKPGESGWFLCGDNAALNLNLNTTVAVNGVVAYEVVPA